jgi:hypothetical protein
MNDRRGRPSPLLGSLAALAALAVLVTLGACGGDDDDDAGGDEPSGAEAEGACALVAIGDVSELFGEDAQVVPAAGDTPASTVCLWEASSGDDDFPIRHQLQLSVYDGGGPLDPAAYGQGAEAVDGLGDEAFVVADGALGTTAGYQAGERTVIVTYGIVGGDDAPSPADQADAVVELLRSTEGRDPAPAE